MNLNSTYTVAKLMRCKKLPPLEPPRKELFTVVHCRNVVVLPQTVDGLGPGGLAMDAKLRIAQWKNRASRLSPAEIRMVFEGRKPISLWDMTVILADFLRAEFYVYVFRLEANQILDEVTKGMIREGLSAAQSFCEILHLPIAAGRIPIFQENGLADKDCTGKIVQDEFSALMDAIERELKERKLVFIPPNLVNFLEQEALFGDAVNIAFPSAKPEIKDAGNCLAGDLNTAAVFHLMRVVEIGLRAMAKHLNVPIKNQQMEYLQWQTILDQIRAKIKINTSSLKPLSKKKADALEFYNGTMGQFEGFKDEFRNNVMHTRTRYDKHKAMSTFLSVKGFMERLAVRVHEKN